jgi:hypothetical protein
MGIICAKPMAAPGDSILPNTTPRPVSRAMPMATSKPYVSLIPVPEALIKERMDLEKFPSTAGLNRKAKT